MWLRWRRTPLIGLTALLGLHRANIPFLAISGAQGVMPLSIHRANTLFGTDIHILLGRWSAK